MVPFPNQKGKLYNADNLATVNRTGFDEDESFNEALASAESRWGTPGEVRNISWRLHVVLFAASEARRKFANKCIWVELGTGKGYMAAGICKYFEKFNDNPTLYCFDSFSKALHTADGKIHHPAPFAYTSDYQEVLSYFSKNKNIKIEKGILPNALVSLPNLKISFLHVDLNDAVAEYESLNALKSKLKRGAIIVFDDYGGPGGQLQSKIHEKFALENKRNLMVIPTGQAIIFW